MIYNKLFLNIIVRVSIITITCICLAYSLFWFKDWLLVLNLLAFLAMQVYLFIRSMNKTNYDLEMFFTSLESNDTSLSFKNKKVPQSYQKLLKRMNIIKQKINDLRMENEKNYQYFKAVVENVGVGLIVCQQEGKIELLNEAGRKILGIPRLNHINQLDQYFGNLSGNLMNLPSRQQTMVRLNIANSNVPVSFKVNDYSFLDHPIRLISFQNIKNELDEQELESWQKLIRVLTHEIMNSTGPITSSIDTIKEFLIDENTGDTKKVQDISQDTIHDILRGITIIKDRSMGLSEFVKNFRSLTLQPKIKPEKFAVEAFFNHVQFLLADELYSKKIDIQIVALPKNLEIFADRKLIAQVILNLVYNSMDALENRDNKQICLKAFMDLANRVIFQVIDNGKGIPPDMMDTIFVPFFTTKPKGSGIGLTLSREIMKLHGGYIKVFSEQGKETVFTLVF